MIKNMFLNLIKSTELLLYNNEIFTPYSNYCSPTHRFHETPKGKLQKLIVFARHGDRAPLKSTKNWVDRNCLDCDNSGCALSTCKDGLLSVKGFDQTSELGKFIKMNYFDKFENRNSVSIQGVHTGINRTMGSLHGVLKGMGITNSVFLEDPEITLNHGCGPLQEAFDFKRERPFFTKENSFPDFSKFDTIMASVCNDVSYSCSKCDLIKIQEYLKETTKIHRDQRERTRLDFISNGIAFANLANLIRRYLDDTSYDITYVSSHDSTLIRVLNGLNIVEPDIPSYASAVFIEVWEIKDNPFKSPSTIIRVNYNGVIQKFGLYSENAVYKKEFLKYLDLFGTRSNALNNTCRNYVMNKDKEQAIADTTDIFQLLLEQIQERNLTLLKNDSFRNQEYQFGRFFTDPIKKLLGKLTTRKDSYLFKSYIFGFGGKDKDEKKKDKEKDKKKKEKKTESSTEVEEKTKTTVCENDSSCKDIESSCRKSDPCKKSDSCNSGKTCPTFFSGSETILEVPDSCGKTSSPCGKTSSSCGSCGSSSSCNKSSSPCGSCSKSSSSCGPNLPPCEDAEEKLDSVVKSEGIMTDSDCFKKALTVETASILHAILKGTPPVRQQPVINTVPVVRPQPTVSIPRMTQPCNFNNIRSI